MPSTPLFPVAVAAMLPPSLVSLPFKLLLFVAVDGWYLLVQSLVNSFHPVG